MVDENSMSKIIAIKVEKLYEGVKRDAHKTESGCIICGIPFKNKNAKSSKKHVW